MSMKLPKRPRFNTKLLLVTGLLLGAMIAQPFQGMVNALQQTDYTQTPFTDSELVHWTTDRSAPSGGFSSIDDYNGRDDVLELRVDGEGANLSGTQFYATEGLKKDISADSIKADLYVDTAWAGHSVRAGLWGVGVDSTGNVSSYPIVEYTTVGDDGFVGWRAWDSTSGVWTNKISATPGWSTVEILHDKDAGLYEYSINGTLISSHDDEGSVALGSVILNNRNYGSSDYAVRWSNFAYGSETFVSEAPLNLRLADINGDPMLCGDATNQNYITPTWNAVEDAVSYNYRVTLPSGATHGPINVGNVTSVSGAFGAEGVSSFSVQAVYADGQTSDWSASCAVTYDKTSPTTPTLSTPANNSFKNVNDFYFDWTDSSDASALSYEFQSSQNSATNGGVLTSGIWSASNLPSSTIHSTGANGTWYWQVRAVDAAGNTSAWTPVWKMTIDMVAPVASISVSPIEHDQFVEGTVEVTGVVQAGETNIKSHWFEITGPEGYVAYFNNMNSTANDWSFDWDTTQLENGDYKIRYVAADKAGNRSDSPNYSNPTIKTVTVNNPAPVVSAQDFGVGTWTFATDGFTAVSVGFSIQDFRSVSGITVDLYNQNGQFVTNTAMPAFVSLINSEGWSQLSSPFAVSGTLNDTWCAGGPCWGASSHTWTSADKPVKAVITVNGTDIGGHAVTKTAENATFSEAGGTFTSILPIIAPASPPNSPQRGNGPPVPPVLPRAASPRAAAALRSNPSVVVVNDNGQALGASTETPAAVQTGGVLSATDENDDYDSSLYEDTEEQDSFSSSWFWLFAPVALGGTWLVVAALRRNS